MECVALRQVGENLGFLSAGKFVLPLRMSLCFSPVSLGLVDLFPYHYALQSNF